jgi:hypothetical protein
MDERPGSHDELIERLRRRSADPDRRLDCRPDSLYDALSRLELGDMLSLGRSMAQDLQRLVARGPDPELTARAASIERAMATPADRPLPPPATPTDLAAAEARLGLTLPPLLRRIYLELANGGLGPGYGIVGVAGGWTTDRRKSIEDLYEELSDPDPDHPGRRWPTGLVPIADLGGVFACTDTTADAGRIVEWDPEEIDERGADGGWSRSFREVAPSLAAWLEAWLDAPAGGSQASMHEELARSMAQVPEVTRAYWASMTPEQRAGYGLPETGWGRALFGDAWGDDPRDRA